MRRTVFFLSDRTGITVEVLGRSLLSQFKGLELERVSLPFVDTPEKARRAVEQIDQVVREGGPRPLVLSTLTDGALRGIVAGAEAAVFDLFETFLGPLEAELQVPSTRAVGTTHGMADPARYRRRIDAVHFALNTDDGTTTRRYSEADLVLVGVSRTGKTPTCLYLALQYGVAAANYPLTEEDMDRPGLPAALRPFRDKLYGLSIDPERLHQIRSERRPDSPYASRRQCRREVEHVEALFASERIPWLDTTTMSVEEIAATIVHDRGLRGRV